MKVYVLTMQEWDDSNLYGVFHTVELAEKAKAELLEAERRKHGYNFHDSSHYSIIEFELGTPYFDGIKVDENGREFVGEKL